MFLLFWTKSEKGKELLFFNRQKPFTGFWAKIDFFNFSCGARFHRLNLFAVKFFQVLTSGLVNLRKKLS